MARGENRPVTVHTIAEYVGVSPSAVSTVLANRHEERRLAPATGVRSTGDVARFTPKTANAALTYSRGRMGGRISYNYMGRTLWDYSSDASRLRYRDAREMVNVGLTYQVRRGVTLSLDLANVFNEPQEYFRALPDRLERATFNGTTVTFGVSGRF